MENLGWIGLLFLMLLFVMAIGILYDVSPKFKYSFKFIVFVLYISFVCLISIPLTLLRPKNVANMMFITPLCQQASKFLGIKWEVRGAEILRERSPCVIVCNHQSGLDVLGMAQVWPMMRRCAAVAKKELVYVFPLGLVAYLCGTVFIDRSKGTKSIVKLSTTAESIQESKTKLWIFPEGTRHKGADLLPFKKGAFHIAMQCKLPIVPVVISPYTFVDDEQQTFDQGSAIISVLPPIQTTGITDVDLLTTQTRDLMNAEFHKLSDEVYSKSKTAVVVSNGLKTSTDEIKPPSGVTMEEVKKFL